MRLIAGCPIANRAWAVPRWIECLAAQTRRPDMLVFIASGDGETPVAIAREADRHGFEWNIDFDPRPTHERHDNERFRTLADLRNRLLQAARDRDADLFLSLDSDIMLEDPTTIERLIGHVQDGWDIAAPATFLHPAASDPEVDADLFWAYNAAWWQAPIDGRRTMHRPLPDTIAWGALYGIDIPMAVWLGNRDALDCRYEWHESGEDLGFALDLERNGLRCVWDTSIRAQHIWCEQHMKATA